MNSVVGLWLLLAIYFLGALGPQGVSPLEHERTDYAHSALSQDFNEVDHNQTSFQNKLISHSPLMDASYPFVLDIMTLEIYNSKMNYLFVDLPPYIIFLHQTHRPPIASLS